MSFGDGEGGMGGTVGDGCCPQIDLTTIVYALESGLSSITEALTKIDETLEKDQKTCQKMIDECGEELINFINESYNKGAASCEECKSMLNAGMAGTLEYAVACAGACINEEKQGSPCDQSESDGSPCTGCGCEPCECVNHECVSVDPESCNKPKVKYWGWCNPETGEARVTEANSLPPAPGFGYVAEADTEAAALREAEDNCPHYEQAIEEEPLPPPINVGQAKCNIYEYSPSRLQSFSNLGEVAEKELGAYTELVKRFREVGLEEVNLGSVQDVMLSIWTLASGMPASIASEWIPRVSYMVGCNNDVFNSCAQVLSVVGTANKITGVDLTQFCTPFIYAMNAACRNHHLPPDKAMQAYLSDSISSDDLDTFMAIAGICPPDVEISKDAARTRLGASQLITMRYKNIINEDKYFKEFRKLGYTDDWSASAAYVAAAYLPDLATAIRVAGQTAYDDQSATDLGLDHGYEALINGTLGNWLHGHGVNDYDAKLIWRSHWTTPSYGQLADFWKRYRHSGQFGGAETILKNINSSLTSLGIPPYWHDMYLQSMLEPLQRRDILRAYENGVIKDDELKTALEVVGYNGKAVEQIMQTDKIARRNQLHDNIYIRNWCEQMMDGAMVIANLVEMGIPNEDARDAMRDVEYKFADSTWAQAYVRGSISDETLRQRLANWGVSSNGINSLVDKLSYKVTDRQAIKNYTSGTQTRQEAYQELIEDGISNESAEYMLSVTDDTVTNSLINMCANGIRQRYVHGELTFDEAKAAVAKAGIKNDRALDLVSNWSCQRSSEGKQVAVNQLCNWLGDGSITQADMLQRLMRMDYTPENAQLILDSCVTTQQIKATKEATSKAREAAREAEKLQRLSDKAQATIDRENRQLAAARSKAAKIRADRDRQLISASEKLYKLQDSDLPSVIATVRGRVQAFQSDYGLSLDEALQTVLLAAEQFPKGPLSTFEDWANKLADEASKSNYTPEIDEVGGVPIVNGDTQPSG